MGSMFGTCPKCGGAYPIGIAFCSRCGQPLGGPGGANVNPPARNRRFSVKMLGIIAVGMLVLVGAIIGGVVASSGGAEAEASNSGKEPLTASESAYMQSLEPVLTEFQTNLEVLDASMAVMGEGVSGSGAQFSDSVGDYIDGLEHFSASLEALKTFPPRLQAIVPPERFTQAHSYLLKAMNGFSAMADAQLGMFSIPVDQQQSISSALEEGDTDQAVDEYIEALNNTGAVERTMTKQEIATLRDAAAQDYSRGLELLAAAVPD